MWIASRERTCPSLPSLGLKPQSAGERTGRLEPNAELRDYVPRTAMFVQADPIGLDGSTTASMNVHGYASANPLKFIDPTGMEIVFPLPGVLPPLLPPVFIPGTPQNQQFVNDTKALIQQLFNETPDNPDTPDMPPRKAGACPNPEDIEGKSSEEIDDLMQGLGWNGQPSNSGGGTRYPNPDVPGEQVRVMPGYPNQPIPVRQGPYVVISSGGNITYVPISGNPTLAK
jgi:RHS repeat-associated protein